MSNIDKVTAEMSLLSLKEATETLMLVSLATTLEGSVDRIDAGISTVTEALKTNIDTLGKALGYGNNFFCNGVE